MIFLILDKINLNGPLPLTFLQPSKEFSIAKKVQNFQGINRLLQTGKLRPFGAS
jgi:hypothetical protein